MDGINPSVKDELIEAYTVTPSFSKLVEIGIKP
jgi:hypothetical protein